MAKPNFPYSIYGDNTVVDTEGNVRGYMDSSGNFVEAPGGNVYQGTASIPGWTPGPGVSSPPPGGAGGPVGQTPGPGASPPPGGAGGPIGQGADPTSHPYYQQLLALNQAQSLADAAARRQAIQQALIAFGQVPSFKDKYGDVDAVTRALAEKNTKTGISAYARMLQGRADANRFLSRRLTARGLRRSGAKGYGLRRNQLGFDQNYADALSALLGNINSLYGVFTSNEYQRQLALMQALQSIYNSGWGQPPEPPEPTPPSSDPSDRSSLDPDYTWPTPTPGRGHGHVPY